MGMWQASARKWPDLFSNPDVKAREAEIEQKMQTIRPVVETGCVYTYWQHCLMSLPYPAWSGQGV